MGDTLLTVLEAEAIHLELEATEKKGAPIHRALLARRADLLAAAERLRAALTDKYATSEELHVIERINGGPLPHQ